MRRFAFTPRWMAWHLLMALAVVTCLWLADWQWVRAETTGSLQNWGYALQWPLFAVFFAVMWWRMLRLESIKLDELEAAKAESNTGSEQPDQPEKRAGAVSEEGPGAAPANNPSEPVGNGPVPAGTGTQGSGGRDDDEDPELAAYNRMLAELAAEDERAARS